MHICLNSMNEITFLIFHQRGQTRGEDFLTCVLHPKKTTQNSEQLHQYSQAGQNLYHFTFTMILQPTRSLSCGWPWMDSNTHIFSRTWTGPLTLAVACTSNNSTGVTNDLQMHARWNVEDTFSSIYAGLRWLNSSNVF